MVSTPFVAVPPKDYGGTELVIHQLAEGLVARGHEVTLFATGESAGGSRLRSLYPRAQWPPEPLVEVNHVTWALAEVARGDFSLAHVHSATALGAARLMTDVPLVYTLHHEHEPTYSAYYHYFPHIQFVAISHDQRRREDPLARCAVVHHGLDPSCYGSADPPGDYVCFLGRFSEIKGPHVAVDVALRAGVPIRLAGAVHPPDRNFAERELAHRMTHEGVTALGPVGPEQKRQLLARARALLAPIAWNEPFGLVLIEAMLSGTPPIAFRRGSAPELIEPGVTGFLVESADEMAALIRPGGAVDRFDRAQCRAMASERFGRDRMVTEYERVYETVIVDAGGRPFKPSRLAV